MSKQRFIPPQKIISKTESTLFYLLLLFLPTQLGKHFWPDFSIVSGIRIDYLSPTVYVTDIVIGILFVFWFLNRHSGRTVFARMTKGKSIYSIFCLFLVLNSSLSQNYLNGFYHLLKFLEFSFVAYYVATTVVRVEQVKKIFLILEIGVIGQSVLAISQFLNQGSLGSIFYFIGERTFTVSTPGIANASINGELVLRSYGTFSHPNVLAGFLLVVMIGLLFLLSRMKTYERGTALFLGTGALLLTMGRVAIVLWILLLLFVLILSLQEVAKSKILRGGQFLLGLPRRFWFLAMTIIFVVLVLMQTPFSSRFIQTNLAEEAVVTRIDLMTASLQLFSKQPVIGVGFGNFLPVLATIATPLPLNLYLQPVHNIFFLVLAETGIIGFGVFAWFLIATYQRLFHLAKDASGLLYRLFIVFLTVVLLLGSFDHYFLTLQQGQLLFALIVGLCWTRIET